MRPLLFVERTEETTISRRIEEIWGLGIEAGGGGSWVRVLLFSSVLFGATLVLLCAFY